MIFSLSAAILAKADLVGLGVQVPQVLIPQHPAIVEGIAVSAVVVTISGVLPPTGFMTVISLATNVVVEVSAKVEEHGVGRVGGRGVCNLLLLGRGLHVGHLGHGLHVGGGGHHGVVSLGARHGVNKLANIVLRFCFWFRIGRPFAVLVSELVGVGTPWLVW